MLYYPILFILLISCVPLSPTPPVSYNISSEDISSCDYEARQAVPLLKTQEDYNAYNELRRICFRNKENKPSTRTDTINDYYIYDGYYLRLDR